MGVLPLVPTQSASAFSIGLDVTPETIVRATDTDHRLFATVTADGTIDTADGQTIRFDRDDNPVTADEECLTVGTPTVASCSVLLDPSSTAETETIRAFIEDGPPAVPCGPIDPPVNQDADCTEGRDEATTPGTVTAEPDETDVVEVEWEDVSLEVTPETGTAAPGATVNLTATVKSIETAPAVPRNVVANVDAEILGGTPASPNANKKPTTIDMECTTSQVTGTCTLSYTAGPNVGVDSIQAWIDENDDPDTAPNPVDPEPDGDETSGDEFEADPDEGRDEATGADPGDAEPDRTDVVEVSIATGPVLDLSPQTTTKNVGEEVSLVVTFTQNAQPLSGQRIAAAVLTGGPNAGKLLTCTTTAGGTCTLKYISTVAGQDRIRATADTDGNGQPNEADATEDVGTIGGTAESDATDVSRVTWVSPTTPPGPDPDDDDSACQKAQKKLKKAKKALKKAKASENDDRIAKAKKRVKTAKKRRRQACA
jgi:hypothetical protein